LISNNIGMPQTAVDSVSVWGIPILFEIKLRAYRYRVFCSGCHMIETCPILKLDLTCLASSRGRQNGGLGHTGIGDLAVCPKFVNLLPGVNSTAVDLKIYILSMI
jgi:hypothetical protein